MQIAQSRFQPALNSSCFQLSSLLPALHRNLHSPGESGSQRGSKQLREHVFLHELLNLYSPAFPPFFSEKFKAVLTSKAFSCFPMTTGCCRSLGQHVGSRLVDGSPSRAACWRGCAAPPAMLCRGVAQHAPASLGQGVLGHSSSWKHLVLSVLLHLEVYSRLSLPPKIS